MASNNLLSEKARHLIGFFVGWLWSVWRFADMFLGRVERGFSLGTGRVGGLSWR